MRISTTNTQLIIQFTKREGLNSFRRRLVVPKSSISNVAWRRSFKKWPNRMLRAPGSYLPGVIMAGSYYSPTDGWDFVYAHRPKGWSKPELQDVLIITTDRRRYHRIILSQPQIQSTELQSWLSEQ